MGLTLGIQNHHSSSNFPTTSRVIKYFGKRVRNSVVYLKERLLKISTSCGYHTNASRMVIYENMSFPLCFNVLRLNKFITLFWIDDYRFYRTHER